MERLRLCELMLFSYRQFKVGEGQSIPPERNATSNLALEYALEYAQPETARGLSPSWSN
jgi:hypothetical protein